MNDYTLFHCDIESTGLSPYTYDIVELSLYRSSDDVQKTWCLKPFNLENIDTGALRINGHKLEDITHRTKYGVDTYLDPNKVIVEIENWVAEDNVPSANRVLCGANSGFDKGMLDQLWIKCNSPETFPFGRRYIDIQQIEFFLNMCQGEMLESYSLFSIAKKYGIKNEKSHTAASDTMAAKQVFDKQVEFFRKVLSKQDAKQ